MAEFQGGNSRELGREPLAADQQGQSAGNIIDDTIAANDTKAPHVEAGASMEAQEEAVKDQVDDAIPKGPKKADQNSGGRVIVAEQGDLHDLAARRHSRDKALDS